MMKRPMLTAFFISLLTLTIGAACASNEAPIEAKPPTPTVALSAAEAEALYIGSCAPCHGQQGEGYVLRDAPALNQAGQVWQYTDGELIDLLRNGRNQMPNVGATYTAEEMTAIVAYLKRWWTVEQKNQQEGERGE